MKSIKQQYIDLTEGKMSQANFMRNLRMTMPQYITNVTSFNDSIKILKNKGILSENVIKQIEKGIEVEKEHGGTDVEAAKIAIDHLGEDPEYYTKLKKAGLEEQLNEAKDEKTKWTNTSGKIMYDQFKEIDNLNGQEVLIGIDYEMIKNPELTKAEAAKIVVKNLKKNPIYYTAEDMSGVEGYEPEYIGGKSAQPEANQMQPLDKNMGNVVDKKLGMQPVKDVEKAKKDSDKATAQKYKTSGVSLMSLIAKTVRGVKKMDPTGEKMKKIAMKEARLNDFPGETPGKIAQQIQTYVDSNPTLKQYSDEITLQSNPDGFLRFGYWDPLPSDAARALGLQFNIEPDFIEADEDTKGGVFYRLAPKHTPGKVNLNKVDLMNMIREELKEMFDGMEPMDRTGLDEK